MTNCFVCRERKSCEPAYCGRMVVQICAKCWRDVSGIEKL